jgi:hypothetical protein
MKKKLLGILIGCSFAFTGSISAQGHGTTRAIDVSGYAATRFNTLTTTEAQRDAINKQHHDFLLKRDPAYDVIRNEYEKTVQKYLSQNSGQRNINSVITVPIVIHIVWNSTNAAGNITDAQAMSQVTVLNEDYARTNADTVNTPSVWKSRAANTHVQFCLAKRTPTGTATNGIERRQNNAVTSWTTDDAVKKFSTGGLDAWDPTKYLNIWVCDLGGGLLGYGEFPTGTVSPTYGVAILNSAFGNTGTVASPYQLGRTTTHEFSHCFNLYHIWGDDNGACTGDDLCSDTPNQANSTTSCPTFPSIDACANSPAPNAGDPVNGIMFMNYMDYSYDNCMNMFTTIQSNRTNAVLAVPPYNTLTTSNGCVSIALAANDAGVAAVNGPVGTICTPTFTPVVQLKNFGTNALTSCSLKYNVDGGGPGVYNWTGNLASQATTNITLPTLSVTAGGHLFKSWTTNPNGGADGQAANDTSANTFDMEGVSGIPLVYYQGFETNTFVPNLWTLNNPDGATTWALSTSAGKTGTSSAFMDNYSYSAGTKQFDELQMPGMDMTTTSAPVLTFQVAYTYYNQTTGTPAKYTDTLNVLVSTNCGTSWTSIYKKGGAQLATATPINDATSPFVPTASQWRMEVLPLTAYASSKNTMIKFRNISDNGDDLYLDDINVSNYNGINELQLNSAVQIFPNPTNGAISINLNLPISESFQVRVLDMLGRTLNTIEEHNSLGGQYNVDLSKNENGIYFVEIITDQGSVTRKVILDRK